MTDTPQILLGHHLKVLKLPTFLREYDKLARQCATEGVEHTGYLLRLPQAIVLARRTQRIIRQNLGWALAYNLVALPFAALGWVTPGLAAIGMATSSLVVTANALRLGRIDRGNE